MIEPTSVEEVETLKPIIQYSGVSQHDMAAGFAARDGFDFKVVSPMLREKYLNEAAPYFDSAPKGYDPYSGQWSGGEQKPGGLRGGVLRAAEGIDRLLRGR